MKKSEKIEIRMSPEEKERLAKRAEAEGRPVSEVVRTVLSAEGIDGAPEVEASSTSRTLSRWGGYVLAFIVGGGMTFALSGAHPTKPPIEVWETYVDIREPDADGGMHVFTGHFSIANRDGAEAVMMLSSGPKGGFEVRASTEKQSDGLVTLGFSICRRAGDFCTPWATPYIQTVANEELSMRGRGPQGTEYYIRLKSPDEPE